MRENDGWGVALWLYDCLTTEPSYVFVCTISNTCSHIINVHNYTLRAIFIYIYVCVYIIYIYAMTKTY